MRVEIIELLRCPVSHELTPLIAVADERDGDRLIAATLGCPVCGTEFLVRHGIAQLVRDTSWSVPHGESVPADALRIAALLNLVEPGRRVALCGAAAPASAEVSEATGAHCVVFNASDVDADDARSDYIRTDAMHRVPLADASLDAFSLDAAHQHWLPDAVRVVRTGGRILAPADAAVPGGCTELARDASEWVGEVLGSPSTPVRLRKARAAG